MKRSLVLSAISFCVALLINCSQNNTEAEQEVDEGVMDTAIVSFTPSPGPKTNAVEVEMIQALGIQMTEGDFQVETEELTDEEFFALAEELGFPIDNTVDDPEDTGGCTEDLISPPMSSTCSITYDSSSTAYNGDAYTTGSCYSYYKFPGDSESDCYIRFANFWPGSWYSFETINSCASSAAWYYGDVLAAYDYDPSSQVYLRLDRRWCKYSTCENGFLIY